VFLVLFALPVVAHAQRMTLEQALEQARSASHIVKAASEGVNAAQSAVSAANAEYLPTLSASGSYNVYDGDIFYNRFVVPGLPTIEEGVPVGEFDTTEVFLLDFREVLYAGGARSAQVDARRLQTQLAEKELDARRRQLESDVTRAFYDVLLAQRSVEVVRGSIERSDQNLADVRSRLAESEALQVEVLGAETQLAADRHDLLKAENQLTLARRAFNHHLAREQDAPVELDGDLARASSSYDASTATERALANSPDLQKSELAVELADAMLRGAKSNFKPKVELQGVYSYLDNELFFEGSYWGGALNLSVPFFKGVRAGRAAADEARARKALEQSALEAARSGVALEVERSLQAVQEAQGAVELATKALEYQRERYRVTNDAYGEQLATFSQVLDDNNALREAELQLSGAQHQARVAEADLRRLTGAPAD
jgi:outer membrane protein TolC